MSDKLMQWVAWRLPRRLVYWCSIRLLSFATVGRYSDQEVPALTVTDALARWPR